MITWDHFIYFAIPPVLCWIVAGLLVYSPAKKRLANAAMLLGILILATFITAFWIGIERPPLRTIGETRLWYSFFLAGFGYVAYRSWHYPWLLSFSALVAIVFIFVNLLKPEIHSKNLMPALQSIWFIPHVISYILSYAMLGSATIAAFYQLHHHNKNQTSDARLFQFIDNVVYLGFAFLVLGMLLGSIWAKEAWGHYWSWDPKETWAFITAVAYLCYIHLRLSGKKTEKIALWLLPIAFILLMITWIGVNYLPAAQGSIHVY